MYSIVSFESEAYPLPEGLARSVLSLVEMLKGCVLPYEYAKGLHGRECILKEKLKECILPWEKFQSFGRHEGGLECLEGLIVRRLI